MWSNGWDAVISILCIRNPSPTASTTVIQKPCSLSIPTSHQKPKSIAELRALRILSNTTYVGQIMTDLCSKPQIQDDHP